MSASIDNPHFLLRRLHSLFGVVPVGAFLLFHLWENSQSRFGAAHYNEKVVGWIQGLNYLPLLELFFIALPILFHALYGIVIIRSGRPEPRHPFLHNRLYLLQRVSGIAILLFLLFHVAGSRGATLIDPTLTASLFEQMQGLLSNPFTLSLYALGMGLSVFHLCYGLWSFGISWGITTGARAQRLSFLFCMALMLPLIGMGLHGLYGFLHPYPAG